MWNTLKIGLLLTITLWVFCHGQGYTDEEPDNPLKLPTKYIPQKDKPEDSAPAADTTDTKVVQTHPHDHDHDHHDHHHHYHGQDGKYNSKDDGRGWDIRKSVPGEPNMDYPVYHKIPRTGFKCTSKSPGYYADVETRCQVFRVCTTASDTAFTSFLCANGSLFNQFTQTCDWWQNVDCEQSNTYITNNKQRVMPTGNKLMEEVKKMIEYPFKNESPSKEIPNFLNDNQIQETGIHEYLPPGQVVTRFSTTRKYYTPTVPAPVFTQRSVPKTTPRPLARTTRTYLPPFASTQQIGTYPKPQAPAIVFTPPKRDTTTQAPTPSAIYVPAKPISPASVVITTPKSTFVRSAKPKLITNSPDCGCNTPHTLASKVIYKTSFVTKKHVRRDPEPVGDFGEVYERTKIPDGHPGYKYDVPGNPITLPSRNKEIGSRDIPSTPYPSTTYRPTTYPTTTYRTTYPTTTYRTTYPTTTYQTTTYRTTYPTTTYPTTTYKTTYPTTTYPTTTYRTTYPTTTYTTTYPTTTYPTTYRTTYPTTERTTTTYPTTTYRTTTYPTTYPTTYRTTTESPVSSEPTRITLYTDDTRDNTLSTKSYEVVEQTSDTPDPFAIKDFLTPVPTSEIKPSDFLLPGVKPNGDGLAKNGIDIRQGEINSGTKIGYSNDGNNKFGVLSTPDKPIIIPPSNFNSQTRFGPSNFADNRFGVLSTPDKVAPTIQISAEKTNTFKPNLFAGITSTSTPDLNFILDNSEKIGSRLGNIALNRQQDLTFLLTNDQSNQQVLNFKEQGNYQAPSYATEPGLSGYAGPKLDLNSLYANGAKIHEQNLNSVGLTHGNRAPVNIFDPTGNGPTTARSITGSTQNGIFSEIGQKSVTILENPDIIQPTLQSFSNFPQTITPITQNDITVEVTEKSTEGTVKPTVEPTIFSRTGAKLSSTDFPTTENDIFSQTTEFEDESTLRTTEPSITTVDLNRFTEEQKDKTNKASVQIENGEREESLSLLSKGVLLAENNDGLENSSPSGLQNIGFNQDRSGKQSFGQEGLGQEVFNQQGFGQQSLINQGDQKYSISISKSENPQVLDGGTGPLVANPFEQSQYDNSGIIQQINQGFGYGAQFDNQQQFAQQPYDQQQYNQQLTGNNQQTQLIQQNIEGQFQIQPNNYEPARNQPGIARIINQGIQQQQNTGATFSQNYASGAYLGEQNRQNLGQLINTGLYNFGAETSGSQFATGQTNGQNVGFSSGPSVDIVGSKPVFEFNYGDLSPGQGFQHTYPTSVGQNTNTQNLAQEYNTQSNYNTNAAQNTQNIPQDFSSQSSFTSTGNTGSGYIPQEYHTEINYSGNQNLGGSQNFGQGYEYQNQFVANQNIGISNPGFIQNTQTSGQDNGQKIKYKETVHVEIVPSIGFTFDSEASRQDYLSTVLDHFQNLPGLQEEKDGSSPDLKNGKIALSDVHVNSYNGPSSYLVPQSSVLSLPTDSGAGNHQGYKRNTEKTKEDTKKEAKSR